MAYIQLSLTGVAWTINLKSFEIEVDEFYTNVTEKMNYKLEKFWNLLLFLQIYSFFVMNYKLEKFWNHNKQLFYFLTSYEL